jgi:mobilome CxxCx(11)CxxC protein
LRQQCWERAIHAFGSAYIFERRARSLSRWTRALDFFAIGGPLLLGGVVGFYGTDAKVLRVLVPLAGAIGLVQLVAFGWSLVARWSDRLSYARESTTDNYRLSNQYKRLAQNAPADMRARFEVATSEEVHRPASTRVMGDDHAAQATVRRSR